MNEIQMVEGLPRADSRDLAEWLGIQHKNLIAMLDEHEADIRDFGTFAFQTRKSAGRPDEIRDFTVDFDQVWSECGYASKQKATDALRDAFIEGEDFAQRQVEQTKGRGGHNRVAYSLTPECAIEFRKLAKTETALSENIRFLADPPIQLVALQAQRSLTGAQLSVLAIQKLSEENAQLLDENGTLKLQLEEAAPKVEAFDAFIETGNDQPIARVAKLIGTGQKKLFAQLRKDQVLRADNTPYQQHLDAGRFRVKAKTLPNGRNYCQTFVTPKGVDWLAKTYPAELPEAESR